MRRVRYSDISQVACPSITARRASELSSFFAGMRDELLQVEMLVGQRVRQLVHKRRVLHTLAASESIMNSFFLRKS